MEFDETRIRAPFDPQQLLMRALLRNHPALDDHDLVSIPHCRRNVQQLRALLIDLSNFARGTTTNTFPTEPMLAEDRNAYE
jgi:hypothetical protein